MADRIILISAQIGCIEMTDERPRAPTGRNLIKRVLSGVRGLPNRLLRRRRHFAARDRLSQMDRPRNILVVCYGNICRSPYLAAVLARALPDVRVESAGIVGPGRPVPPFSLALSAQRGLDLSTFRSSPLLPAVVRNADLVIVMDAYQAGHIERYFGVPRARILVAGDLDPAPAAARAIVDPWDQPIEVFTSSFNRLDRCAAMLVGLL